MFGRKFPWEEDEEFDSDDLDDDNLEDNDDDDDDDTYEDDYSYADDDDDDDDDEDDEDEDETQFDRIERAFREERATIRSCDNVHKLRTLRAWHVDLAESGACEAGRIRARDLVELVDERITDIKARRLARRYR